MVQTAATWIPGLRWGDENVPYFAIKIPPVFVPPETLRGLVGKRRVGGLSAWHSELAQIMFAPAPSILQEFQPTIFRAGSGSFARKSDGEARKMVGWNPCKIGSPRLFREVEFAAMSGPRPHPPYAFEPGRGRLRKEQIPTENILLEKIDFHHPRSTLYFPVKKSLDKTESSSFIDTRVVYRSARNDDCRDDSL